MRSSSAEKLVKDKLLDWGIDCQASFCGFSPQNDAWGITFSNIQTSSIARFDFFTGLGLRENGCVMPPSSASVLYCLITESLATDENFEKWAANYGYCGIDSIYQHCIKNAEKLREIFSAAQINELAGILEYF